MHCVRFNVVWQALPTVVLPTSSMYCAAAAVSYKSLQLGIKHHY